MDAQQQTALIQQALGANPQAIALLIRDRLEPLITVKAALKDGCLYLLLASDQAPSARLALETVEPAIEDLAMAGLDRQIIQSVKVGGQSINERSPKWCYHIDLPPLPYSSESDELPIAEALAFDDPSLPQDLEDLQNLTLEDFDRPEGNGSEAIEEIAAIDEGAEIDDLPDEAASSLAPTPEEPEIAELAITELAIAEPEIEAATGEEPFEELAIEEVIVEEVASEEPAIEALELLEPAAVTAPEPVTAPKSTEEVVQLQATLAALTGLASTLEKAAASLVTAVGSIAPPAATTSPDTPTLPIDSTVVEAVEAVEATPEPIDLAIDLEIDLAIDPEITQLAQPEALSESPEIPKLAEIPDETDFEALAIEQAAAVATEAALSTSSIEEPEESILALTEEELADWDAIEQDNSALPEVADEPIEATIDTIAPEAIALEEVSPLDNNPIAASNLAALEELDLAATIPTPDDFDPLDALETLEPIADAGTDEASPEEVITDVAGAGEESPAVAVPSPEPAAVTEIEEVAEVAEVAAAVPDLAPEPALEPTPTTSPAPEKTIAEKVTDAIASLVHLVEVNPNADVNTALAAIARLSSLASPIAPAPAPPPEPTPSPIAPVAPPEDLAPAPEAAPPEPAPDLSSAIDLTDDTWEDQGAIEPSPVAESFTVEAPVTDDPQALATDEDTVISGESEATLEDFTANLGEEVTEEPIAEDLALEDLSEEIAEAAIAEDLVLEDLSEEAPLEDLTADLSAEIAEEPIVEDSEEPISEEFVSEESIEDLSEEVPLEDFAADLSAEITEDLSENITGESIAEESEEPIEDLSEEEPFEDFTADLSENIPEEPIAESAIEEPIATPEPAPVPADTISHREAFNTIAQLAALAQHRSDLDLNAAIATIARLAGLAPEPPSPVAAPNPEPEPPAVAEAVASEPINLADDDSTALDDLATLAESEPAATDLAAVTDEDWTTDSAEQAAIKDIPEALPEALPETATAGLIDDAAAVASPEAAELAATELEPVALDLAEPEADELDTEAEIEPAALDLAAPEADQLDTDELEFFDLSADVLDGLDGLDGLDETEGQSPSIAPAALEDVAEVTEPAAELTALPESSGVLAELSDTATASTLDTMDEPIEDATLTDLAGDLADLLPAIAEEVPTDSPAPPPEPALETAPETASIAVDAPQTPEPTAPPPSPEDNDRANLISLVAQLLGESADPRSALLALAESLGDPAAAPSAPPVEPPPVEPPSIEPPSIESIDLAADVLADLAAPEPVTPEVPPITNADGDEDWDALGGGFEGLEDLGALTAALSAPAPGPIAEPMPVVAVAPETELPELSELPDLDFGDDEDQSTDSGWPPMSPAGDDEPSGFFETDGFAALVDIATQALTAEDLALATVPVASPAPIEAAAPVAPSAGLGGAAPAVAPAVLDRDPVDRSAAIAPPPPEPEPIANDPLSQWLHQGDGSSVLNLSAVETGNALSTDGQRFLRFHLGFEDTALLPIDEVREVLRIAATDILPVPHMPESVLGVYNWRGEIVWTIDLNQLVGFPAIAPDLTATSSAIAIVLECDGQHLGLVVPQIEDIEWHDSPNVQPPSAGLFPDRLLPFVQGYLSEASSMVLNPRAIARASAQQAG